MLSPVLVDAMKKLVREYGLVAVMDAFRLAESEAWKSIGHDQYQRQE